MKISGSRVLITGASGFIGSHVARACVREGAEVSCLVRPGSDLWRLLDEGKSVRSIEVNMTDAGAVKEAVTSANPQIIFHLAANTNRKRDLSLYGEMHAAHVQPTLNLISAALGLSTVPRFIHTGTIEEYGRGPVPYREDQFAQPISPYSLTKYEATELVLFAAREYGLSAIVLRPSLTYGSLKGRGMFIPDFLHAALTTKVFDMSPGEQTRDFIHVDDTVRAHLIAAEADGVSGEIFNVATGVETKLKDVAETLRALSGGDVVVNYGAYPCDPNKETMRCFMNIKKINDRLSWKPNISLNDGLASTVEWYLKSSFSFERLWI